MKKKRKAVHTEVPIKQPDISVGLTEEAVQQRVCLGLDNSDAKIRAKSVFNILKENVFTPFNLLSAILGLFVLLSGPKQNATFLVVVFINLFVGTIQQLRAKVAVEKLSLLSKIKIKVLRDGVEQDVDVDRVVLHDILILKPGNQIPADAVVVSGFCEVDESLLTGESDAVYKMPGEKLLSGSYVFSGTCKAMAEKVGKESYAAALANSTRGIKKINSEILNFYDKIIKFLGIFIIVLGVLLFLKQYFILHDSIHQVTLSTAAAIIGMIPEGLVLLTNVVLAVGVMDLSRKKMLVQEMYCIETLARVNVLCIDKTGTITEGKAYVSDIVPLREDVDPARILRETIWAIGDVNNTALAIKNKFPAQRAWLAEATVPFSPIRKWSGASFPGKGSYLLGAPEILLRNVVGDTSAVSAKLQEYAAHGARTVLLVHSDEKLALQENTHDTGLPGEVQPVAIVLLEDCIREESAPIFRFFQKEGVDIKIISGDAANVAYSVAEKAGVRNLSGYIDTFDLTEEELKAAVSRYSVFGRVSPEQKKLIVRTLKENGNVVAMMGDGVNDILALREADCSIAIASGSNAVRLISQIVLLDSNLYSLYYVVMKGRKVINNIKRSASLFLVKTIFSCLLSVAFLFLPISYPFLPIQLSLVSSLCVGIPSFFLAMQPNTKRVTGSLLGSILHYALPGALCVCVYVIGISILGKILAFSQEQVSTLCTLATGVSTFYVLGRISQPFNLPRLFLLLTLATGFTAAVLFFKGIFFFSGIGGIMWPILGVVATSVPFLNSLFTRFARKIAEKHRR